MKLIRSVCLCTTLTLTIIATGVGPAWAQASASAPLTPAGGSIPRDLGTVSLAPPHPADSAVGDLFRDIATDFRRLPSKETATWLTIGAAAAAATHFADRSTSDALSGSRGMGNLFSTGATLGGAGFQFGAALATYGLGRTTGNRRVAQFGADLVRANVMAQALSAGVKMSIGRTRPDGTGYSFPSGHTTVSFAAATVVQRHFGWKAGIPAYAAASYVAASRIQDRRHFLSDVTFGAMLGIAAGRTVTIGHGGHRFALVPIAAAGGAGVGFTLVP
jgi:membrane-associated phospholipid phosphatase